MLFVQQTPARVSQMKYKKKTEKDRLEQLQAEIKSLKRKDVANVLLPAVLEHVAMTKEGRTGIAKAVAKKQRVSLPAGGISKAAVNKAKKTATDLMAGLATILHPENPKKLQSMLRNDQEPTSIKTVAPMHPRNPHSSNSKAVLPGRVQASVVQVPPLTKVTMDSLALLMSSDDEDLGAASSQPDSADSSSNTSECHQERKTAHRKAKRANQKKLGRKSMTYKSAKKQANAIEAVRKSLGDALIKHIQKNCKTVRERRPLLALVALDHRRKDVNNALGIYTNSFEWRLCQIHAKYPGPIKPVRKPLIRRLRIKKELLFKLLSFLKSPGNLQRSAFGRQLKELLDGLETVELDNVARLKKLDKLVADYISAVLSELDIMTTKDGQEVPDSECRCIKLDQKIFHRCLKARGHDGKCAFTAKDSVCPSTVRSLIASLTAGDLKSLSGLDDVKVLKGRDNFKKLREVAKRVCDPTEEEAIIKRIDDCELYHQTDYVPHLERHGTHRCNCLTCGFHDKGASVLCSYLMDEAMSLLLFFPPELFSPSVLIMTSSKQIHPMIFAVLTRRSTYHRVENVLMDLLLSWSSEAKSLRSCMGSKSHLLWIRQQFPRLAMMEKAKMALTPPPLGFCPIHRQSLLPPLPPPPPERVKSSPAFLLILLLPTAQAPMTPLSYLLTEMRRSSPRTTTTSLLAPGRIRP